MTAPDPVAIPAAQTFATLARAVLRERDPGARRRQEMELQRACASLSSILWPPEPRWHDARAAQGAPCSCWMCSVLAEVARLHGVAEGTLTHSLGASRGGGGAGAVREQALDRLTLIERRLREALHRDGVQRAADRHGLGHLVADIPRIRCGVCTHPHRDGIERLLAEGASFRAVETWTREQGDPVSHVSLWRHRTRCCPGTDTTTPKGDLA